MTTRESNPKRYVRQGGLGPKDMHKQRVNGAILRFVLLPSNDDDGPSLGTVAGLPSDNSRSYQITPFFEPIL